MNRGVADQCFLAQHEALPSLRRMIDSCLRPDNNMATEDGTCPQKWKLTHAFVPYRVKAKTNYFKFYAYLNRHARIINLASERTGGKLFIFFSTTCFGCFSPWAEVNSDWTA